MALDTQRPQRLDEGKKAAAPHCQAVDLIQHQYQLAPARWQLLQRGQSLRPADSLWDGYLCLAEHGLPNTVCIEGGAGHNRPQADIYDLQQAAEPQVLIIGTTVLRKKKMSQLQDTHACTLYILCRINQYNRLFTY